ncbi:MAG: guanylate kinase [Chloroflexi bacterium]|nr:guanylate kinase [Chloroflexota bacterium]MDP6498695.1 guanylate kinase [Dehalococcoidia bacterium]MQG10459.1 guanylate kinase [SAR202 cluster bacterium]MQG53948.1 guanylate kinase [SAR202 cluster bacterium]
MPENDSSPLLVVLSGPSGVGKDAALNELRKLDRPWHFVVTATTRAIRPGETDGVDYIFLDEPTFIDMKDRNEFVECAEVYGRWYGVPRSQVTSGLEAGKDVILKIDVQGAATVRQMAPNALFIFMVPGSFEELQDRLSQRMTESTPEMELRLKTAMDELRQAANFDRQVMNSKDNLRQAVSDIDATIAAEKQRSDRTPIHLL